MNMEPGNYRDSSWINIIIHFFQQDQWNFMKVENQAMVRAGYRGEHGTWVCYAWADEENQLFIFHSLMGLNIPPHYRSAVAEYLVRVNYQLVIGNFDMDIDTGNVRFRTAIELIGDNFSVDHVRSLAYTNVRTMDFYFPGVMAVVHGGLLPEAALDRVNPNNTAQKPDHLIINK